jgi:hypothetical protein
MNAGTEDVTVVYARKRTSIPRAVPAELQLKYQDSGCTVTNWESNPAESKAQLLTLAGLLALRNKAISNQPSAISQPAKAAADDHWC